MGSSLFASSNRNNNNDDDDDNDGIGGMRHQQQPPSGSLKRSLSRYSNNKRDDDKTPPTLYDILGASPKDTPEQLKRRYTALVRTLHPDANVDGSKNSNVVIKYELSEINAAWQILGTPKERLKYDRSLKAKEFTIGVEALVDLGIATAIPFIRDTARSTAMAVDVSARAAKLGLDVSGKVAQEGAGRARLAYTVFELEQQSKTCQQRAVSDMARARKLMKDLDQLKETQRRATSNLQTKIDVVVVPTPPPPAGTQYLSSSSSSPTLTFLEAQRLIRSYQPLPSLSSSSSSSSSTTPVVDDLLDVLRMTEQEHRDCTESFRTADRSYITLDRTVERTERAEMMAFKKLEDAQRAVEQAQLEHMMAIQARTDADTERSQWWKQRDRTETSLRKIQEKVRLALLKQQGIFLTEQEIAVKNEVQRLEGEAQKAERESFQIRQQIIELEERQRRQQS